MLVSSRRLLADLGPFASFEQQLPLREKLLHADPIQLPNIMRKIRLFDTAVPLISHQLTHPWPVLLPVSSHAAFG